MTGCKRLDFQATPFHDLYGSQRGASLSLHFFFTFRTSFFVLTQKTSIATNATFKQAKTDLIRRKWDPSSADDDTLYWLDGTVYRRLNDESWIRIERGDAKL